VHCSDGSLRFVVMYELDKHFVGASEPFSRLRYWTFSLIKIEREARRFAEKSIRVLLADDGHGRRARWNAIASEPRMSRPMVVRSLPHPLHRILIGQACAHPQTARSGPLLRKNSRTNAEGLGELIKVAFQQMNLASNISSKIAFRHVSKSLAQLFMGNIATQNLNLREQMKAEIASDERRMLRATRGQNNLIVDYNNQLLKYNTHILGLIEVCMLTFPCFDYHGTTITSCTRSAWYRAD
jgi:hypothetical protein